MSFTHWYDEPPYRVARYDSPLFDYDIPAIIQAVREHDRGEMKVTKVGEGLFACGDYKCNYYFHPSAKFCPHCGLKIRWE